MSSDLQEEAIRAESDRPITTGFLFRFSLPLMLTFIMMSGAAPLVSNGITWMHGEVGERIHLSAFLMTFITALMIYSPMFVARNVAIRTINDRRSLKKFVIFFTSCALVSSFLLLGVSQVDFIGHLYYGRILNASPEIERLARQGLLVFIPIPLLVAWRGMGQGCHITNKQGWFVGFGTLLRLTTMAIFVFGFAIHHDLSGPVLGAGTYLSGIAAETLFVLLTLLNKPLVHRIDPGPLMSYRQFSHYAGPLMFASLLNQFTGPMLLYLINTGSNLEENGASYNLLRDTGWMMFSTLMCIQPAVIANATSRANLRALVHFGGILLVIITGVTALVALTPIKEIIFVGWFKVDNEMILHFLYVSLIWMIPVPLINLSNLFLNAVHTRSGRTVWVTAGNVVGLIVLAGIAWLMPNGQYNGAIVAVIALAIFNLSAALVQVFGLFRGGIQEAISPHTLAEQYHRKAESRRQMKERAQSPQAEEVYLEEPLPERVRTSS